MDTVGKFHLAVRLRLYDRLLAAALGPLFTTPVADLSLVVRETVAKSLWTAEMEIGSPGPDKPAALGGFDVTTLLIEGETVPVFLTVCSTRG